MRLHFAALFCWCALACSSDPTEVAASTRLFIDTDLPTPEIANRLRIDLYREDGTWFATRDVTTASPSDFPVSFDLAAPASGETVVIARLRLHPDTYTREYRGESFVDWPAVLDEPPVESDGGPRLIESGQDRTPELEPLPSVTVDRLVELRARAGESRALTVVLHGACAGSMADLGTGASCVSAREQGRSPLAEPSDPPTETSHGNDLRESCEGIDPGEGRICVPGGVFVLGDRNQADFDVEELLDSRTERLVRVRRFFIDENEIDVARYRVLDAPLRKSARYSPQNNDGPLSNDPLAATACTYSRAPRERESHPLNCNTWGTFRLFCQLEGGDLPSEVQWEYAASAAGSAQKRRFPWGNEEPSCERAVYARVGSRSAGYCTATPALVPVGDPGGHGDVTPLGIRGLSGSLTEYVVDAPISFVDARWTNLGFDDPRVENPIDPAGEQGERDVFGARGGSWVSPSNILRTGVRQRASAASPFYGARCVYPSP